MNGIRIIKLFAWETDFIDKANKARSLELKALLKQYIFGTLMWVANYIGSSSVLVAVLAGYTLVQRKPLTPAIAFTAFALLQMLASVASMIPFLLQWVLRAQVSFSRLEKFLEKEDLPIGENETQEVIGFEKASFTWDVSKTPALNELDFFFPIGELSVIVGPTGSGKTSLVMALLGGIYLLCLISRNELLIWSVTCTKEKRNSKKYCLCRSKR